MTGGWASLARVAAAAAVAVAASGCHHHRDLNAPGVIDPMLPPAALRDRELEEALSRELLGQRKPRNKPVAKSVLKSAMAQMAQG